MSDLPRRLQGLNQQQLRGELDILLAKWLEDRPDEEWANCPLENDQQRQVRLLALYLGDERWAVRSLVSLARRAQFDVGPALGLAYYDQAVSEAQSAGLREELARCRLQRAHCLEWASLYQSALREYETAHTDYLEIGDTDRAIFSLSKIASLNYHRLSRYETAFEYYERCRELADNNVEPSRLCPIYSLWGYAQQHCGQYPDATATFALVEQLAEQSGDAERIQSSLGTSADIYVCLGDTGKAQELLLQAIALTPEVEADAWRRYDVHLQLARLYHATGRRDESAQLLESALTDIADRQHEASEHEREAYIFNRLCSEEIGIVSQLGAFCLDEGNVDEALEYYMQAQELGADQEYLPSSERMEVPLATALIELGRYQAALEYLNSAEECGPGG